MFIYEKIPDIKLTDIVKNVQTRIFNRMPKTLKEFCEGVEADGKFYPHHTNLWPGSKTVQSFHRQIYNYLETLGAVKYSINDTLLNANIDTPLAITYRGRVTPNADGLWRVKDIPVLYDLSSGKLRLPPHHQAKITEYGKVPETVAGMLRDYVRYVLKCEDKNPDELQRELITLASAGILTVDFYNQVEAEMKQYHKRMESANIPSEKQLS